MAKRKSGMWGMYAWVRVGMWVGACWPDHGGLVAQDEHGYAGMWRYAGDLGTAMCWLYMRQVGWWADGQVINT